MVGSGCYLEIIREEDKTKKIIKYNFFKKL